MIGSTGIICQNNDHPDQVIKAPFKHKLDGCSTDMIEITLDREEFSKSYFEREKAIYGILPQHPNILDCIETTEDYICLPFMRFGSLDLNPF